MEQTFFTSYGRLYVCIIEGIDLIADAKSKVVKTWLKKPTKEYFSVYGVLSIIDRRNKEIKKIQTAARPYKLKDSFLIGEEFCFEPVSSSLTIVISIFAIFDSINVVNETCVGITRIPLSRLEDNQTITQWYQLLNPSNDDGLRSALKIKCVFNADSSSYRSNLKSSSRLLRSMSVREDESSPEKNIELPRQSHIGFSDVLNLPKDNHPFHNKVPSNDSNLSDDPLNEANFNKANIQKRRALIPLSGNSGPTSSGQTPGQSHHNSSSPENISPSNIHTHTSSYHSHHNSLEIGLIDYCVVLGPSNPYSLLPSKSLVNGKLEKLTPRDVLYKSSRQLELNNLKSTPSTNHTMDSPFESGLFSGSSYGGFGVSEEVEMKLWDRLPRVDLPNIEMPSKVEWFACPEGHVTVISPTRPENYSRSFILCAGGEAEEVYGITLSYFVKISPNIAADLQTPSTDKSISDPYDDNCWWETKSESIYSNGKSANTNSNEQYLWTSITLCVLFRTSYFEELIKSLKIVYEESILPHIIRWEYARDNQFREYLLTAEPSCYEYDNFVEFSKLFVPCHVYMEKFISSLCIECPKPIPKLLSVRLRFPISEMSQSFRSARLSPINSEQNISSQKFEEIIFRPENIENLPKSSSSFSFLLNNFGPRIMIDILCHVLSESRMIFHSQDLAKLPIICEGFRALIYPLSWTHVYLPVVPAQLLHLIEAPVPFLLGTHSDYLKQMNLSQYLNDVILIDCDTGCIERTTSTFMELPEKEDRWLIYALSSLYQPLTLSDDDTLLMAFNKPQSSPLSSQTSINICHCHEVISIDTKIQLLIYDVLFHLLRYIPDCLFYLNPSCPVFNRILFMSEYTIDEYKPTLEILSITNAFHELTETVHTAPLAFFYESINRLVDIEKKIVIASNSVNAGTPQHHSEEESFSPLRAMRVIEEESEDRVSTPPVRRDSFNRKNVNLPRSLSVSNIIYDKILSSTPAPNSSFAPPASTTEHTEFKSLQRTFSVRNPTLNRRLNQTDNTNSPSSPSKKSNSKSILRSSSLTGITSSEGSSNLTNNSEKISHSQYYQNSEFEMIFPMWVMQEPDPLNEDNCHESSDSCKRLGHIQYLIHRRIRYYLPHLSLDNLTSYNLIENGPLNPNNKCQFEHIVEIQYVSDYPDPVLGPLEGQYSPKALVKKITFKDDSNSLSSNSSSFSFSDPASPRHLSHQDKLLQRENSSHFSASEDTSVSELNLVCIDDSCYPEGPETPITRSLSLSSSKGAKTETTCPPPDVHIFHFDSNFVMKAQMDSSPTTIHNIAKELHIKLDEFVSFLQQNPYSLLYQAFPAASPNENQGNSNPLKLKNPNNPHPVNQTGRISNQRHMISKATNDMTVQKISNLNSQHNVMDESILNFLQKVVTSSMAGSYPHEHHDQNSMIDDLLQKCLASLQKVSNRTALINILKHAKKEKSSIESNIYPLNDSAFQAFTKLFNGMLSICSHQEDYINAFGLLEVGGHYFRILSLEDRQLDEYPEDDENEEELVEFLSEKTCHHPIYQTPVLWKSLMHNRLPPDSIAKMDDLTNTVSTVTSTTTKTNKNKPAISKAALSIVMTEVRSLLYIMLGMGVNYPRALSFLQGIAADYHLSIDDYFKLHRFCTRLWSQNEHGNNHHTHPTLHAPDHLLGHENSSFNNTSQRKKPIPVRDRRASTSVANISEIMTKQGHGNNVFMLSKSRDFNVSSSGINFNNSDGIDNMFEFSESQDLFSLVSLDHTLHHENSTLYPGHSRNGPSIEPSFSTSIYCTDTSQIISMPTIEKTRSDHISASLDFSADNMPQSHNALQLSTRKLKHSYSSDAFMGIKSDANLDENEAVRPTTKERTSSDDQSSNNATSQSKLSLQPVWDDKVLDDILGFGKDGSDNNSNPGTNPLPSTRTASSFGESFYDNRPKNHLSFIRTANSRYTFQELIGVENHYTTAFETIGNWLFLGSDEGFIQLVDLRNYSLNSKLRHSSPTGNDYSGITQLIGNSSCPSGDQVLFSGCSSGVVKAWSLPSSNNSSISTIPSTTSQNSQGTNSANFWALNSSLRLKQASATIKSHSASITCLTSEVFSTNFGAGDHWLLASGDAKGDVTVSRSQGANNVTSTTLSPSLFSSIEATNTWKNASRISSSPSITSMAFIDSSLNSNHPDILRSHRIDPLTKAVSSNLLLAIGSLDGLIRLADITTEKPIFQVEGHSSRVVKILPIKPNEFLSCGYDRNIKLWDIRVKPRHTINNTLGGSTGFKSYEERALGPNSNRRCSSCPITEVSIGGWDNSLVISASADGVIKLWDLRYDINTPCSTIRGHNNRISSIVWNGRDEFYTSAYDGSVRSWDSINGKSTSHLPIFENEGIIKMTMSDFNFTPTNNVKITPERNLLPQGCIKRNCIVAEGWHGAVRVFATDYAI